MTRKLKALVFTLTTFLVVGAMSASSAMAAVEFHSESGLVTFEPESEGVLELNYGQILCNKQVFHGYLDEEVSLATIKLKAFEYECGGPFGTRGTVQMNGCEYSFRAGETDASKNYEGKLWIECPTGKLIEIPLAVSGQLKCMITIPGQSELAKITYVNKGTGKTATVEVVMALSNLSYTQDAGSGIGACVGESAATGVYKNNFTLKAERVFNFEQTGMWIK